MKIMHYPPKVVTNKEDNRKMQEKNIHIFLVYSCIHFCMSCKDPFVNR